MWQGAIASPAAAPGQALSLGEIVGAFSYALDITEGQPEGHCVRACWIGMQIGGALGLGAAEMRDLYYTILLKDLGCSSNAARICELYLADDRSFKRGFKLAGTGTAGALAFVLSHTAKGAPLGRRVGAIGNILTNGSAIARELIETRCTRGADIARRLRFPDQVAEGIFSLDELWDGSGKPIGLAGNDIPLNSRIALLSQVAEVFHAESGPAAAAAEVRRRSGRWFDPELVSAFLSLAAEPAFWDELCSPLLDVTLLALEPAQHFVTPDEDYLDDIAAAFGEVVDAKSPYTAGHSLRVADYAEKIAARLNYDPARRRWLRRGAFLHDIGKLGVSNRILDKPGRLDPAEWELMRAHATTTQSILGRISAFHDMAPVAAAHHERLDGTGYPLGLAGEKIGLETRIISVCDFFDALTADRPYRGAMAVEDALALMSRNVGSAIDADCFDALVVLAREEPAPVSCGP